MENTKPAIIHTVTESSQRGPKVVVLDEFKSHLEVRGTAGAPPSPLPTPASRGFRTPRVASSRSHPHPHSEIVQHLWRDATHVSHPVAMDGSQE